MMTDEELIAKAQELYSDAVGTFDPNGNALFGFIHEKCHVDRFIRGTTIWFRGSRVYTDKDGWREPIKRNPEWDPMNP